MPISPSKRTTPIPKPDWLRAEIPHGEVTAGLAAILRQRGLHTVCEEARCPNMGECWGGGTATFLLLGDVCTRGCRFCAVKTHRRGIPVDEHEPEKVADAIVAMRLRYAVLTMVDRDDLDDGGAAHFARTIQAIKVRDARILVEALAGDFQGRERDLVTLLDGRPDVFAHNLETVRRLTPRVRDLRCDYDVSLRVLADARRLWPAIVTKSSLMLGLGESEREVDQSLADLRAHDVDIVTLGQYLRPSLLHLPVQEHVAPSRFAALRERALRMGFRYVAAGPLVRSSYRAGELFLTGHLRREHDAAAAAHLASEDPNRSTP
jgi:lipoic acid synthetase